jgi:hypothetical protein
MEKIQEKSGGDRGGKNPRTGMVGDGWFEVWIREKIR